MVNIEEVEALMLKHFPQCPLCGADKGYEVSGWAKSYVQCRLCGAKWESTDFISCKELKELQLWDPSSDGKGTQLTRKKYSVKFWQDPEAIKNAATRTAESKFIFHSEMTDQQLETLMTRSLEEITHWDYGSTIEGKGLGFLISNTSSAEAAMIRLLRAIFEQNKITIIQNELLRRALLEVKTH
jgi:hypothetical protein